MSPGYVYHGYQTIEWELAQRRTAQCGTTSGYQKHHREGTIACRACLKAQADYVREARHAKGTPRRRSVRCGTLSGYNTHSRLKEPSCAACREAMRLYKASRRHLKEAS